ncbi:MAG: rRNA pseudouridine synthase [Clostridia bacterium]|nr:rRNA pseudouridine synthase [Clostridia bacterium]
MSQQRLDKIIASQGKYSRSDVKKLARNGDITVNGKSVSDCGMKVDPEKDSITVCGESFGYSRFIYIMLNKPEGVVSASRSPGEKTVVDLVPEELYRDGLFPAGRLDKDTTGFVLITDDGAFAHDILSPKKHIEKTYIAQLDRPIGEAELDEFRSGITLGDGYECLPASISVLSDDGLIVEIKLREGKYHQIKRMAAACGSHVNKLHRVSMGGLELDGSLNPGECRLLDDTELAKIKEV